MASSVSFSRATFAKLSPHPLLVATLTDADSPSRTNGRATHEARPINVHSGSLSHAHGSAVVRIGDTTVICGVRGEVLPVENIPQYRPYDPTTSTLAKEKEDARQLRDYDLLVPNIELATGCAPQFLPGVPPTTLAQTLSTRIYALLHKCAICDVDELRVWYKPPKVTYDDDEKMKQGEDEEEEEEEEKPELKAYWVLYIDLLFISYDGNPFDAAWAAVLAALRNSKLPVTRWDPDRELVVCSPTEKKGLTVSGLPIASSAIVFLEKEHGRGSKKDSKHWLLLDPDRLEESLGREAVTMVVDRSKGETRIHSIEKQGGTALSPQALVGFARLAEERWDDFRKALQ